MGEVKRTSIGLAEGFLKPYIAAQRQGQIVIGAAGGNFAGSPQQLKAYLDALSAELDTKTVVLYPDAGAIANNAVMGHYERVIQMVSKWGYSVEVAWWGQLTKDQPDVDELPDDREIAYLAPEEFLALGDRERPTGHSFAGMLGWLPRFKRYLEKSRREPWGFGRKGEVEVEPPPPQQDVPKYDQGERIDVWSSANHLGYKHILDTSDTGLGKSYDAGRLAPEMFPEARQIIYISREHRNPTTDTLRDWHDLEARHEGLYRDAFGKLRRVDKDQFYVVPPNCGRNKAIGALRSKNIPGADTAELVCTTCPHFEPCRAGAVFGFLNQRAEALAEPRLRAHPDSLPDPGEYDYDHVVLLWEEAGNTINAHRSIEVRDADVSRTIADLVALLPDAFDALRPLLTALHLHMSGEVKQPNKYGWGDAQVRKALPALSDLDLGTIREALKQNPERILNGTQEHGVDVSDLPRGLRKKFTASDNSISERIARELALNWLPDFLEVLLGNTVGSLRIQYGVLTVTLGSDRLTRIAQAAGCNIYLDATATTEDIARSLGLADSSQTLVVRQAVQPPDNLEVIQVTTIGRLGLQQRSDYCTDRVSAVIAQFQKEATGDAAAMDFKRHTNRGDGKRHWWVDDRGINDLETCQTLILVGTPCPNLGDLQAEFTVLYGRPPSEGMERVRYPVQVTGQPEGDLQPYFEMEVSADPAFREFVRRRILASYHQAIGRLRAHRRSKEKLRVVIIADYPLDIPVTLKRASDITPEAASKSERVVMAMLAAAKERITQGQKVTQQAIAAMVDRSQQLVSRYWGLLQTLLESSNSKSSKTSQPPPDPGEIEWMSREYLPLLAESPPDELKAGVLITFEVYSRAVFKTIWDAAPATAQIKILQVLALTLPAGELRALAHAVGVNF